MSRSSLRKKQNKSCFRYAKYHADFECCPSCHEDLDLGDGAYLYREAPNGKSVFQCCAYVRLLDDLEDQQHAAAKIS